MQEVAKQPAEMSKEAFVQEVLNDYRIAFESRQASLIGRKEVLTGKAKFGIFGDGKEIAQIAMAKVFQHGDWRSGYYRDQTFMFAKGISSIHAFFAQLYAIPDTEKEPASGGRSMNGHFATRLLDDNGNWLPQTDRFNSSADISPTAGQMPRLLGLAVASKLYRQNPDLHAFSDFSNKGNEIAFGTIGNASSSEGIFWEVMNAACVMQVPMLMSLWDDGYGISVPAKYQTAKENIAALMRGFQSNEEGQGLELLTARGWNYPELCKVYKQAADICREKHTPVLVHVTEVTQPQGHSTSGSHERYKSKERLEWETEFDGIAQMRQWMIEQNIADETTLTALEEKALEAVKQAQKQAWIDYLQPIKSEVSGLISLLQQLAASGLSPELANIAQSLSDAKDPIRRDMGVAIHKALRLTVNASADARKPLLDYLNAFNAINGERYSSHVYSQSESSV
ncbi:MAG: thiamine pyrophosphate-dependent dehydrogenase E1 component subunit alpha, partial [Bacteroidetes bacterium]|nr:thiamine pyrophosphate-dependent dehydrogenase E1 component subunit alpha [Bacteroidota bacterium]